MVSISAGRPKVVPPAPRVDPTGVKPTNGSKPSDPPAARRTRSRAAAAADNAAVPGTDYVWLRRRQLSHDIRHELGTIMMLASLLSCAEDVGPDSRDRARQILGETRWLEQLQGAYEELQDRGGMAGRPAAIRLDVLTGEVIAAMKLSTSTRITFAATETWAYAEPLGYWRALRNVIGNAVRAAGPQGTVDVRVSAETGWAVAQVDDDGPGFGEIPPGFGSLGLGIVQDMVAGWGGELEIRRGVLGGCCVRLRQPVAAPGDEEPER